MIRTALGSFLAICTLGMVAGAWATATEEMMRGGPRVLSMFTRASAVSLSFAMVIAAVIHMKPDKEKP